MSDKPQSSSPEWFQSTLWTVVLTAKNDDGHQSRDALEKLCQTYWYPLYTFARSKGASPTEAQDLTQGFFHRFLEKDLLKHVERNKGKFRSYLLTCFRHFMTDEYAKASRQKRGGNRVIVSLDEQDAEGRYLQEPVDKKTPEELFERNWALTLVQHVLKRLEEEYEFSGKGQLFARLKDRLVGGDGDDYSRIAQDLHMKDTAVRMALSRMRKRYGILFREEIANTVATSEEVEEELQHLMVVLSGG